MTLPNNLHVNKIAGEEMHGRSELKIRQECVLKSHENASPSDRVKLKQQL